MSFYFPHNLTISFLNGEKLLMQKTVSHFLCKNHLPKHIMIFYCIGKENQNGNFLPSRCD